MNGRLLPGLLAGVTVLLAAVAFIQAGVRVPDGSDELHNWTLPAHLYFHVGATPEAAKAYGEFTPVHIAYPPGLSLVETFAAHAMGHWLARGVLIPFPMFYLSVMLLVMDAVARRGGITRGLGFAVLAGTASLSAGMASQGMADLPLGCLFAAAVLAVERFQGGRATVGWLGVAALLAGIMTTYKREGGPLRLVVAVLVLARLLAMLRRDGTSRMRLAAGAATLFAVATLIPSLPWSYTYREIRAHDWVVNAETLDPGHVAPRLSALPQIVGSMLELLYANVYQNQSLFNATWVLILLVLVLSPRRFAEASVWPSGLALAMGLAGYCFIYVISPFGLYHLSTSFGRLLLHFFPLAVALGGRISIPSPETPAP